MKYSCSARAIASAMLQNSLIFTSGGHSVSAVETESTLHVLQSSKVEWTEESRLDKTWTTRAKHNGGEAERREDPRAKGERERGREVERQSRGQR